MFMIASRVFLLLIVLYKIWWSQRDNISWSNILVKKEQDTLYNSFEEQESTKDIPKGRIRNFPEHGLSFVMDNRWEPLAKKDLLDSCRDLKAFEINQEKEGLFRLKKRPAALTSYNGLFSKLPKSLAQKRHLNATKITTKYFSNFCQSSFKLEQWNIDICTCPSQFVIVGREIFPPFSRISPEAEFSIARLLDMMA